MRWSEMGGGRNSELIARVVGDVVAVRPRGSKAATRARALRPDSALRAAKETPVFREALLSNGFTLDFEEYKRERTFSMHVLIKNLYTPAPSS